MPPTGQCFAAAAALLVLAALLIIDWRRGKR